MRLGFIGCGNMASAMIGGVIRNQMVKPEEVIASAKTRTSLERVSKAFGIKTTLSNKEVTENSDLLFLAVKPQYYEAVIQEIREFTGENQIIISIAPGKTLKWMEEKFGKKVKAVRCMPNTPALVGEGITAVCCNGEVTEGELETVRLVLEGCGRCEPVPESLMDVVVSVSGSSPAYVFMFIEAMADGAVADGMPRTLAYQFAAQAVLGSAKMVLETGKHPGELKDMVCSPGGTTIEAVRVLEEKGLRSSVIEAMKACVDKGRQM